MRRSRREMAAMLAGMGFDADSATAGHKAFLKALASGDYELVLLSDRIDRPPAGVVLDQLRHDPRTARLPIAILAEDEKADLERAQAIVYGDPYSTAFLRPQTPEGMKFFVEKFAAQSANPMVPTEVRATTSARGACMA